MVLIEVSSIEDCQTIFNTTNPSYKGVCIMPVIQTGRPNYYFPCQNAVQTLDGMLPYLNIDDFFASDFVSRTWDENTLTCSYTFRSQNDRILTVRGYPLPANTNTELTYFNATDFLFVPRTGDKTLFEYTNPNSYMEFIGLYGHLSRIDIWWEATNSAWDVSMATKITASSGSKSQDAKRVRNTQNHNYYLYDLDIRGELLLAFKECNSVYSGIYYRGTYMKLTISKS